MISSRGAPLIPNNLYSTCIKWEMKLDPLLLITFFSNPCFQKSSQHKITANPALVSQWYKYQDLHFGEVFGYYQNCIIASGFR